MDLSKGEHDELATCLASLILHDGGVEITSDNLNTLITNSGNEVDAYWPILFAGFLSGDVGETLIKASIGGPSAGGAVGGVASGEESKEAAQEEEEVEEEEEVDMAGGMDMFGGEDY